MLNGLPVPEPVLRFGTFSLVLLAMALLETIWPRRQLLYPKLRRWTTNLSIVAFGVLVGRALAWGSTVLAAPLVAVAAAEVAASNGWGLLNAWSDGPVWAKFVLAVIALDFAIYLQHVVSHLVPVLWRFHRMHHADVDFDVTTALRFHPVEIGLSALYKAAWVLALGPSAAAVVVFEVLLNACAMFNHANVALPQPLDRVLRLLVVTPDMHRVHHSVRPEEHNSNYGFNLSIWDRLCGTYRSQPRDGHLAMTIGLASYQSPAPTRIGWSLWLPFR